MQYRAIGLKIGLLALALWLIISIAFIAVYALPGDPARLILGQRAKPEALEAFRVAAGMHESPARQYLQFVSRTIRLDFGDSLVQRRPVREVIWERTPLTVSLVAVSVGILFVLGILLPLLLHLVARTDWVLWIERIAGLAAATPSYVLAVILLMLFGGWLHLVPVIFDPSRPFAWALPALVLAIYPVAIVQKLFHQELEAAKASPYVLRAQALGLSPSEILLREVLPNAMTPALAGLANSLASFITGTFFVEVVFGIAGLGSLTYEAVRNNDLALLTGLCVVYAAAITSVSGLLDIALLVINPQTRRHHG